MSSRRRVAITGLGALTPIGLTTPETWAGLLAGVSGVGPLTRFQDPKIATQIAAELKDFEPAERVDKRYVRRTDPFIQYALAAAQEAVADSGLVIDDANADRVGVIFGSGIGGVSAWDENHKVMLEKGSHRVSPFFVPMLIGNMAAGMVSIEFGARGPSKAVQTACATSAHTAGDALRLIQYGEADIVITGGCEAPLVRLAVAGFSSMKALSTRNDDPEHACRPFDAERDGFVIAEGAGALVLEEMEQAKARGAAIYGELVGYGQSTDAYHMASPLPCGSGAAAAIRNALADAGLTPREVGYINAHATSTPQGDVAEVNALRQVFGEGGIPPTSATKSMTGHMLGAAGAVELLISTLALHHRILPPTTNYQHPDPNCDLDCIPNEPRETIVDVAISNSFGFGGHNCCLVVKRV